MNPDKPLPPLAQVAQQQGKYVAGVINSGSRDCGSFSFFNVGSLASLGNFDAVLDASKIGDPEDESNLGTLSGVIAFLVWRFAYFGKQVSYVNKLLIPMHWLKTKLFGRDISRF